MGIYDRDYYRDERRPMAFGNWSAVIVIILINVAVFVADMFTPVVARARGLGGVADIHWIQENLALQPDLFTHPWQAWQLLTSGFVHDGSSIEHILFNMFALWLFGMDVERIYGRKEFVRIYLAFLISEGLVWAAIQQLVNHGHGGPVIGASGAIMGIMVVYVCHYPMRQFLLFFAIPMPAWVLGVLYVCLDVFGIVSASSADNVAHTAHLAGAFFGFVYYRTGWSLASLVPQRLPAWLKGKKPKLRVRRDDDHDDANPYRSPREMQQRVDELLEKISREGEASLTDAERRELEEASRRLRNRR